MSSLRIAVLDLQDLNPDIRQIKRNFGLKQLEDFLCIPTDNASIAVKQRLFIIQTSSGSYEPSAYFKLKSLLRTKLHVPEEVFQIHQWRQTTFRFNETINCHRLPTTFYPKARFSLEYFELWEVLEDAPLSRHMGGTNTVMCAMTGRQIQCHKWSNSSSWLMIAPRKCTYWATNRGAGCSKGKQLLRDHFPTCYAIFTNPLRKR